MPNHEAIDLAATLAGMRAALAELDAKREKLADGIKVIEEMMLTGAHLTLPAAQAKPAPPAAAKAPAPMAPKASGSKSPLPMKQQAMNALRKLEPTLDEPHARVEYEQLIVDAGGKKFEKPTMFRALEQMVKDHGWMKREREPGAKPRRFIYAPRRVFEARSPVPFARFEGLEQDEGN